MCEHWATPSAEPVLRKGDLVGVYTGRSVQEPNAHGPYVLRVDVGGPQGVHLTLDAEKRGSMLKYANGADTVAKANARFAAAVGPHRIGKDGCGRWCVPVVATRDLYAHEEVYLWYGPEFAL